MDVVWLCLVALLGAFGLVILFNFDVLARPNAELGARPPDPEGVYLWRALHEASVGRLGVLYSGDPDIVMFENWMKINQIKAIMNDTTGTTEPRVCAEKAAAILAASGGRSMYFDTNPEVISHTYSMGTPSLLVCQPYVVRPEWSTEKPMKGWDVLTEEIDRQAIARAEKKWGDFT